MADSAKDKRRAYERYDTDLKIDFSVKFDLETKIRFQVKNQEQKSPHTHTAFGHDVNVEGIGFSSEVKLKKGDELMLDVFLPTFKDPIPMEGRVMWCAFNEGGAGPTGKYRTGVKIFAVRGENVEKTIVLDPVNKVQWSILLESVFGGFRKSIMKNKNVK